MGQQDQRFYAAVRAMYGEGGSARKPAEPKFVQAVPCSQSYAAYLVGLYEKRLARTNAASARRHAAKLRRTPAWADKAAIEAVYAQAAAITRETGVAHHVDHIYPLQGEKVSGLHVQGNLQVLSGVLNMRKNNHYEP